jgi:hypothetical protein
VDRTSRLILLLVVIALSAFRLVRYLKYGIAKRPQSAIPGSAGMVLPATPTAPAAAGAQPGGGAGSSRLTGALAALTSAGVWVAGNVVLWSCLFGWPALDEVPAMLRGVAGVFANFYLIHLARVAGARVRSRLQKSDPAQGTNPLL